MDETGFDWRDEKMVPQGVVPEMGVRILFTAKENGSPVVVLMNHGAKEQGPFNEWLDLTGVECRILDIALSNWKYLIFFDDVEWKLFKMAWLS